MRPSETRVLNIGINDLPVNIKDSKCLPYYVAWAGIISRCYCETMNNACRTYAGDTVCDEWLRLSNFKVWYDENFREGCDLVKSLLVKGAKVYSPETCCFAPRYIHSMFKNRQCRENDMPIGVFALHPNPAIRKRTTTYKASCLDQYGKIRARNFKTVEEASEWYAQTKTEVVKAQAIKAFLDNKINSDVYLALVRRDLRDLEW